MHMSDYASSLNSDQVYCVLGLNQRAYRFSLARRVVTKKMILTDFTIHIDAIKHGFVHFIFSGVTGQIIFFLGVDYSISIYSIIYL